MAIATPFGLHGNPLIQMKMLKLLKTQNFDGLSNKFLNGIGIVLMHGWTEVHQSESGISKRMEKQFYGLQFEKMQPCWTPYSSPAISRPKILQVPTFVNRLRKTKKFRRRGLAD